MRAGQLNENITVLRAIKERDDYGIDREKWTEIINTKASVKYISGNRGVDIQETFFYETVEFTIRYYHCIYPMDRIKYYG